MISDQTLRLNIPESVMKEIQYVAAAAALWTEFSSYFLGVVLDTIFCLQTEKNIKTAVSH